ncbi:MAG: 3-phosphoshikimate 1-carboxyvinyltransferase [Methanomicrobiales archaeon]|nr:3-phosphoshikimate 1-carboxyvinyltransferase [Methanomicrobiales archaeon]MDI6875802.1 3-phosphoshikimate 1-carboxyvinyltransferase [Methanomicrobiales archaeon]
MNVTMERRRGVDAAFTAPPSKSYTHRALVAAALATGESILDRPLRSEDTDRTLHALERMGVVAVHCRTDRLMIEGCSGRPPCRVREPIFLGNSGTSLRLLTGAALLCGNPLILTGDARLQERPVGPLVEAFNALGGEIAYLGRAGCPPIRVQGRLRGGSVEIDGSVSSQFASSLLMAAPYAERDVEVRVRGPPVSRSYLDVTVDLMRVFGVPVEREGYSRFRVRGGRGYRAARYAVEGDYSSASYFFAIAAVCGGRVAVENLNPGSVQGDRLFLDALEAMGCRVRRSAGRIAVERTGGLSGIEIDMSSAPDTVQTLCMAAAVADSPTTIRGIAHLKYKESDRVRVTAEILRRMGARVEVGENSIAIAPAPLRGIAVDPQGDHRTAMSFAVLGLGIGGVAIEHAEVVEKSFPRFWEALAEAGL